MAGCSSNTGPFGVPPGGPWFVDGTGTIQRQSNPALAFGLANAGWVGFGTQSCAQQFANNLPSGHIAHSGVGTAIKDTAGAATTTAQFLGKLGEAHTWVRIGEFVIGLALFIVGLAAVAGHTKVGQMATRTAAKAALL